MFWTKNLFTNWKTLLYLHIISLGIAIFLFSKKENTYIAELSFIRSNQASQVDRRSFKLFLKGNRKKVKILPEKELAWLIMSRKITTSVLLTKTEYNNQVDYLANHIIQVKNLQKKWKKEYSDTSTFYFSHQNVMNFSKSESFALEKLYSLLIGKRKSRSKGWLNYKRDKSSGFHTIKVITKDMEIAKIIAETTFEVLNKFLLSEELSKPKKEIKLLTHKTDSLEKELNNTLLKIAELTDSRRNLIHRIDYANMNSLRQRRKLLEKQYHNYNSIKNYTHINLLSTSSPLKIIDRPLLPLEKNSNLSLLPFLALLIFNILGSFIIIFWQKIISFNLQKI